MGGFGSGNRSLRYKKKAIVEDSCHLAMRDFRGQIHPRAAGSLYWTRRRGRRISIGWYVTWADAPILTLHYRWRDSEDVRIPVRLQSTPTQFDGSRWWFTCPLAVNGAPCNRRVGKLYLPPGARRFGCRKCHNLTYRSCQEAHLDERPSADFDYQERWLDSLLRQQP